MNSAISTMVVFIIIFIMISYYYQHSLKQVEPTSANTKKYIQCVDISHRLDDDVMLQRLLAIETIANYSERDSVLLKVINNNDLIARDLSHFLPREISDKISSILNDKTLIFQQLYRKMKNDPSVKLTTNSSLQELNDKLVSLLVEIGSASFSAYPVLKSSLDKRDAIILAQAQAIFTDEYEKSIKVLEGLLEPAQKIRELLYEYCQLMPYEDH